MSPLLPHEQAFLTGRWSEIIFRSLSTRVASRWRFVSFRGLGQGEWRGIVDLIAIRKDTSQPTDTSLNRGDLFDIILVQMKGGSAPDPTLEARRRLRAVARRYRAKAIVLFKWRRGVSSQFFVLNRQLNWKPASPISVFG
jgi:hypothetical protein